MSRRISLFVLNYVCGHDNVVILKMLINDSNVTIMAYHVAYDTVVSRLID